ncbi:MAG: SRPBCC family protein [Candidatus Promineifilaceae bacterium]
MSNQVTESIIVKGDIDRIFDLWADFRNFPNFMENIESVSPSGRDRSHWVLKGPLNTSFEWDAETTRLEKNSRIAWRSIEGDLKTSGQVTFKDLPDNEVLVTATFHYAPPAGAVGEVVANLFGQPQERLVGDLRSFKAYAEKMLERLP